MNLTKLYIGVFSILLIIESCPLVTDKHSNVYAYSSDLVIGILGMLFGIILLISVYGMFLEKKTAYQLALITYVLMLGASFAYIIISIRNRPDWILEWGIGLVILLVSLLVNIMTMYQLYKKIRHFGQLHSKLFDKSWP